MVPPRLKVEILVSWLWVKRCVFAGIKKLGWYSVGRVRVSLVLNRFSRSCARCRRTYSRCQYCYGLNLAFLAYDFLAYLRIT